MHLLRISLPIMLAVLGVVSFLGIGGCRSQTKLQGRSSYEQLEPERQVAPQKEKKEIKESDIEAEYIPGYVSMDLKKPIYPEAALAARAGRTVVYVRVSFDEKGQVTDVSRSWRGISDQNAFSEAFFKAVKTAVSTWKIEPPRTVYWQRGKEGEERKYIRTESLTETLDVKFTFEADGAVK